MPEHVPTYRLDSGFDSKLDGIVDRLCADAFLRLSNEFAGIDAFVANARCDVRDRDDHELRRTPKELYLLAAVTCKVHDRLNRAAFNRAKDTLIILPDCLSLHNPDCLKEDLPRGDLCLQCTPTCQASQVMELAEKYKATCVFSKRKLSDQLESYAQQSGDLSVIGIACLLMLAKGMQTAAEVGLPARGVLLNFTGCEHWNEQPFASEFCCDQLESILKEKHELHHQRT